MTVQSFTTAQAASQLSVSESTARRLYDEYTDPDVRLPRGRKGERQLTVRDVETIREVLKLKGDNPRLTTDEIKDQLKSVVFPEPVDLQPIQPTRTAQDSPGAALVLAEALREVVQPFATQLEAQDARLQVLEAQRPAWRDVIFFVLFAFAIGVMVGLAVWWFQ